MWEKVLWVWGGGGREYGVSVGVWGSVLGCERVYGVSMEGFRKSEEKSVGVWKDVRKGIGECVGVGGEARRDVGKCVGVWGEVRGDVRRGVGGGVGRAVEDAVVCGGCGKVC